MNEWFALDASGEPREAPADLLEVQREYGHLRDLSALIAEYEKPMTDALEEKLDAAAARLRDGKNRPK